MNGPQHEPGEESETADEQEPVVRAWSPDIRASVRVDENHRPPISVVPADEEVAIGRIGRDDRGARRYTGCGFAVRVESLQKDVPRPILRCAQGWVLCRRHESIISLAVDLIC